LEADTVSDEPLAAADGALRFVMINRPQSAVPDRHEA